MWRELYRSPTGVRAEYDLDVPLNGSIRLRVAAADGPWREFSSLQQAAALVAELEVTRPV